jgi:16S rRNA (guanine527-N7)-methyltransferase
MNDLSRTLDAGIEILNIPLTLEAKAKLLNYIDLLNQWNQTHNLIGPIERNQLLQRHILDSLSVTPYLTGQQLIDVGSGAGLPGIPLAVALPHIQFTLLDSQGKKTSFMKQACYTLALTNVTVVNARAEKLTAPPFFDGVITRAFSSLLNIIAVSKHLLSPGGKYYAMKGKWPAEELAALPEGFTMTSHRLQIPGLDAERHLIILEET